MIINELKDICPGCKGMGFQAGISRMGISEINVSGKCNECEGLGFLLTEKGRDLIELLRPFMASMFEEWSAAKDAKADVNSGAAATATEEEPPA